jgi:hypothetical protein
MADLVITCPVKRYTGEIVLPDYLTMPQYIAWNKAVRNASSNPEATLLDFHTALLPVVLIVVKKWNLANMPSEPTFDTFPATPARSASELLEWIINAIGKMIIDESDIPNA